MDVTGRFPACGDVLGKQVPRIIDRLSGIQVFFGQLTQTRHRQQGAVGRGLVHAEDDLAGIQHFADIPGGAGVYEAAVGEHPADLVVGQAPRADRVPHSPGRGCTRVCWSLRDWVWDPLHFREAGPHPRMIRWNQRGRFSSRQDYSTSLSRSSSPTSCAVN